MFPERRMCPVQQRDTGSWRARAVLILALPIEVHPSVGSFGHKLDILKVEAYQNVVAVPGRQTSFQALC